MNPINRMRDFVAETSGQVALDRRIREAVTTDTDAARIFQSVKHRRQRIARGIDDPRFKQRDAELQRYAKVKSAKGEMHLFYRLFD